MVTMFTVRQFMTHGTSCLFTTAKDIMIVGISHPQMHSAIQSCNMTLIVSTNIFQIQHMSMASRAIADQFILHGLQMDRKIQRLRGDMRAGPEPHL